MTQYEFERLEEMSDVFYRMDENEWNAVGRPTHQDWLDIDTDTYDKFINGEWM